MARAIFIDAAKREVTEVHLPDVPPDGSYRENLDELYRLIGCRNVTGAVVLENEDYLFVDDESLLKERNAYTPWFALNGITQPICGNGVLVGAESLDGGTSDVKSTVEDIRSKVVFLQEHLVAKWAEDLGENPFRVTVAAGDEPPQTIHEFALNKEPETDPAPAESAG